MEQTEQAKFEGWAVVEIMGHQSHIGYVSTEAFGAAVLFRVDTPALPARDYTLTRPEHTENGYFPIGTQVQRPGTEASSVLLGVSSIYRVTPCTEAAAHVALDRSTHRPLICRSLPAAPALSSARPAAEENYDAGEGHPLHDEDDEPGF